jgi:hypothetical protein
VRFQASAAKIRSALFCDVTQFGVVIPYRRFGTIDRPHLKKSINPKLSAPFAKVDTSKTIGPICKVQYIQNYRPHLQRSVHSKLSAPFAKVIHPKLSAPFAKVNTSKTIGSICKDQYIQNYTPHIKAQ